MSVGVLYSPRLGLLQKSKLSLNSYVNKMGDPLVHLQVELKTVKLAIPYLNVRSDIGLLGFAILV